MLRNKGVNNTRNNTNSFARQMLPNETGNSKPALNRSHNSKNKYTSHITKYLNDPANENYDAMSTQKSILSKMISKIRLQNSSISERRMQLKRYLNGDDISLPQINGTVRINNKPHFDQWKLRRRQLDTYAESLLYVNRIYNMAYGFERRRVPAHMPHLIDKWIAADMQKKFEYEFKITSSHKVRNSEDMQFAFSYFYFLTSEKRNVPIEEIFDAFDTDKSGYSIS